MKLHLISDLHLEWYKNVKSLWRKIEKLIPKVEENDVLVLAGDIGCPTNDMNEIDPNYVELLKKFKAKYQNIVLVSGNHEYYGSKIPDGSGIEKVDKILKSICESVGVHCLNQSEIVINDIRFIGCTLWSDIQPSDYFSMNDSKSVFNDISEIRKLFGEQKAWLTSQLTGRNNEKTVVVTHHLPSFKIIHPVYAFYSSSGFASYLDNLIITTCPKYWFSGHSHESNTVQIGETICAISPMGYPDEHKETKIQIKTFEI